MFVCVSEARFAGKTLGELLAEMQMNREDLTAVLRGYTTGEETFRALEPFGLKRIHVPLLLNHLGIAISVSDNGNVAVRRVSACHD